jgi:hypothetical protein
VAWMAAALHLAEYLQMAVETLLSGFRRRRMGVSPCLLEADPRRCLQLPAGLRHLAAVALQAAVVLRAAAGCSAVAARQEAAERLAGVLQMMESAVRKALGTRAGWQASCWRRLLKRS